MIWLAVGAAFCVVFVSLAIAAASAHRPSTTGTPAAARVPQFLFSANTENLAASSNTGSALSLTMFIGAILPGIAGWGLAPIIGIYGGVAAGTLALRQLGHRAHTGRADATLGALVTDEAARSVRWAQIALYLATITLELALARWLFAALFPSAWLAAIVVLALLLLCSIYTAAGGFLGVLRTDMFQLLVVFTGAALTCFHLLGPIRTVARQTLRTRYVAIDEPLLFITSVIIVTLYFFASPDLWIRTWGTLGASTQSAARALSKSLFLLLITFSAPVLLGLTWLAEVGRLEHSLNVYDAAAYAARSFAAYIHAPSTPAMLVWFLSGAVTCGMITTIDTQLLGVAQHIPEPHTKALNDTRLLILVTALVSFACSLLIGPTLWIILGIFIAALLTFNAMVISTNALWRIRLTRKPIRSYGAATAGLTLTMLMVIGRDLASSFHIIIFANAAFGTIWTAYYGWRYRTATPKTTG